MTDPRDLHWYACHDDTCEEEIPTGDGVSTVECPNCKQTWSVEWDADFDGEQMVDTTTLQPIRGKKQR